jgi:hypothetical protein
MELKEGEAVHILEGAELQLIHLYEGLSQRNADWNSRWHT